jgi:hypothetical protein
VGRELGIAGVVFFAGRHGYEELPIGPNCADPVAPSAVGDPFGMVHVEATTCGSPPLATVSGGPARIVLGLHCRPVRDLVVSADSKDS